MSYVTNFSSTAATKRTQNTTKRTAGPKRAQAKIEISLSVEEDEEDDMGKNEECSEVKQMPRKRARRLTSDTDDNQVHNT